MKTIELIALSIYARFARFMLSFDTNLFLLFIAKQLFSKLQQFSAQFDLFYFAKDKLQSTPIFIYSLLNIV